MNTITKPVAFAGASVDLPEDILDQPAFYERVPLLRIFEDCLYRTSMLHPEYYRKHGRFFVAEAGTYRGRGLKAMLEIAKRVNVNVFASGLDSFEGLPALSETDRAEAPKNSSYLKRTLFSDTTKREVDAYLNEEFADNFELVEGFFEDTLRTLRDCKYAFVNLDCDLYSSHMDCMEYFYNRLLPGGVMFFDDYNSSQYPMAKLAIDNFLANRSEKLLHISYCVNTGNNVKAYFIKQ